MNAEARPNRALNAYRRDYNICWFEGIIYQPTVLSQLSLLNNKYEYLMLTYWLQPEQSTVNVRSYKVPLRTRGDARLMVL